jgi:hypothetical protein
MHRLLLAGLTAIAVALAPVSSALAARVTVPPVSAAMPMTDAVDAGMSMGSSGSDCPCCNVTKKCSTDLCQFNCFTPAISVDGLALVRPLPEPLIVAETPALWPLILPPDPPPPRS